MNKITFINILFFSFILSCNKYNKLKYEEKSELDLVRTEKSYLRIDSVRIDNITLDYNFYFCIKNKKKLLIRIRNQDNSIIFKKKFSADNKGIVYDCYEVNDLVTGIVWNFLHNKNTNYVYETDKYDIKAIGDTLDRHKVNFEKLNAIIYSNYENRTYKIHIRKIYPR